MIRIGGRLMHITFVTSLLLLTTFFNTSHAGQLKPFTSDGCSAFPDGTIKQKTLWLQCCTTHDVAYWKGGSYGARKAADIELKQCVAAVGQQRIAELMLAGVRVGGSAYFPTEFRWGYGWPYLRGYKVLTELELKEVDEYLKQYEMDNK